MLVGKANTEGRAIAASSTETSIASESMERRREEVRRRPMGVRTKIESNECLCFGFLLRALRCADAECSQSTMKQKCVLSQRGGGGELHLGDNQFCEMEETGTNGSLPVAVDTAPTSDAIPSDTASLLPGFVFQTGQHLSQSRLVRAVTDGD